MAKPSRRSRGNITIQDVARDAGVSAMTVSRVINDAKSVKESTRRAVQEAVDRLNYAPNRAARMLAAGEVTHVGLLYANPSAAYLSQFLVGVLGGARRGGCHLIIEDCQSDAAADQAAAARRFAQTEVEGVILPPPLSESNAVQQELLDADTMFVTIGVPKSEAGLLNVRIDDYEAAAALTRHLIELGHKKIGFIRGNPNQKVSEERYRGFCAAIAEAGMNPDDAPVEQGYFTYRSGLEPAERLLSLDDRPTAIFASNDDMAAALVNVAHRRGLSVPGDVSVAGFDDTAPATTIWPELTTIRQPITSIAECALDLLLDSLRQERAGNDPQKTEHVLDFELMIRDSTARPRA